MEKTFIFGHTSPDTDTITSSLVMEDLERKLGNTNAKAYRLGKPNKETEFVLNYLNIEAPELLEEVEEKANVILVDHNSFKQSVKGIENANIVKVIDHHCIAKDFETASPLFYFAKPVGCTATILFELYRMNQIEIEPKIAGLMLSAIISDTLLFKSPTCTNKDTEAAKELAKIANIDIKEYGMDMLKALTDLSEFSPKELINIDSKEFDANGLKVQVAQVSTADINDVLKDKEEIEKAMKEFMQENSTDLFVLAITDIINSNSKAIVLGDRTDIIEKGFNTKLENNTVFMPGVVSRKKQIIPVIMENA